MGVRFGIAKATARGLHWGLTHVARRPGANLPGKVALKLDPQAIAQARRVLRRGAVMVTGTNGKTTVNNLLADCVQRSGASVCCNRTGANLAYGVASALLECRGADWGVIESDELWLGKSLPALQPRFLVLLNLFRDQLDRCGEIDHIQDVIVEALEKSPQTVLIFNADDPLCAMVAERATKLPERSGTHSVAFGTAEPMNLEQNAVSDTTMCQRCNSMLTYEFRQYGQLGAYRCPQCGFARPALDFAATNIRFTSTDLAFDVSHEISTEMNDSSGEAETNRSTIDDLPHKKDVESVSRETCAVTFPVRTHLAGSYMVYNMLAVAAAATCMGCDPADIQAAIDAFDPQNGRLQEFRVGSHRTLLNLAKNPTGFNQNLRIVVQQATADRSDECAIAFFINDRDVDGHDISWIWDIDFEELNRLPYAQVFAGGTRKHDLQVRLKYAGVRAQLIDGMEDVFADPNLPTAADVYAIANYTALAPVHAELDALQVAPPRPAGPSAVLASPAASSTASAAPASSTLPSAVPAASVLPTSPSCEQKNVSHETSLDAHPSSLPRELGSDRSDQENVSRETFDPASNADAVPNADAAMGTDAKTDAGAKTDASATSVVPVVIAHMFPDLLNLYGDGGNVRILEQRLRWRGIPVEVRRVEHGQTIDFNDVDLVFLGGGPDREQTLAADQLMSMREDIARYVEEGGPVLAICGGYQILGHTWLSSDGEVPGLGVLNIDTRRAGTSTDRLIDNIALASPTAEHPVIGYENHASRTYLGAAVEPFGRVVSRTGHGNNDADHADGALYRNVLGTYLHGALLAKNPEVADWLLERALARNALRTGAPTLTIKPLDDVVELAANADMASRLIHKGATESIQKRASRLERNLEVTEREAIREIEGAATSFKEFERIEQQAHGKADSASHRGHAPGCNSDSSRTKKGSNA